MVMAPKIAVIATAVTTAWVPIRRRAVATERATASAKRPRSQDSRAWAWTVGIAPRVSAARVLASATRSWLAREIFCSRRPPSTIGSTNTGMPISVQAARRGLVTTIIARLPTTITTLRRATDMPEPITPRSSSVSADRRETSSPLRLRSKNAWSSPTRCPYRRVRRSAMTRSPSSETKKNRAAVARASPRATTNSTAKAVLMLPASLKPRSIISRTATGRLSVAVEEAASAISQATTSPRWRPRKGSSVRSTPTRALAGVAAASEAAASGAAGDGSVASFIGRADPALQRIQADHCRRPGPQASSKRIRSRLASRRCTRRPSSPVAGRRSWNRAPVASNCSSIFSAA